MKDVKWVLVGTTLLVLTGCVGGNLKSPPVEERHNGRASATPSPGYEGLEPVKPPPGVTVTPLESTPIMRQTQDEAAVAPAWQEPAAPVSRNKLNPAVLALLDNASEQQRRGALQSAENSLERAQRISPREPEVYYRLAQLRQQKGLWEQAEQLALRGLELSGGQHELLRRFWLLIADIRMDAGDQVGAQKAQLKARRF